MTFDEALATMLALLGRRVLICMGSSTDIRTFATIEGTLERGVLDEAWSAGHTRPDDEAFWFSLSGLAQTGFILSRAWFEAGEVLVEEQYLAFGVDMAGISIIVCGLDPT
jgi:hypothetical protein